MLPPIEVVTIDTLCETHLLKRPLEINEAKRYFMDLSKGECVISSSRRKGGVGPPSDFEFCRIHWSNDEYYIGWSSDGAERIRVESSFSRGMKFIEITEPEVEKVYISRVDFCYDISRSLNVFRKLYVGPRRWEKVDFRSGTIWRAKNKRFRIYDKAREAKIRNCVRWRAEVSYQGKQNVDKYVEWGDGQEACEKPGQHLGNCIGAMSEFFNNGMVGVGDSYEPNHRDFQRYVRGVNPEIVNQFLRITEGKKNARRFAKGFI